MEEISWKSTGDLDALRQEIKKEVVKEFMDVIGCSKCKRLNRITEKDLVFTEKQRRLDE